MNVILLDIPRDRYIGLHDSGDDLSQRILGWPAPRHTDLLETPQLDSEETIQHLLDQGLIVKGALPKAPTRWLRIEPPRIALIDGYENVETEITWRDFASVAWSVTLATGWLRWKSFRDVVSRFENRERKNTSFTNARPDLTRLRKRVAVFRRLRPLLFTAYEKCLFDSLALNEFLRLSGIAPRWIFGVRSDPFGAHCWLQLADVVVNDDPEHVQQFTPIMAI